jgi:alpha-D-xyloside xylohydrolase
MTMVVASIVGGLALAEPPPVWREISPGVWRTQVGRADRPTLTQAAEAKPRNDRLAAMPKATMPFAPTSMLAGKANGHAWVSLPLHPGEKVYGLGMQMSGSGRRGGVYHLRVDHYSSGADRLHAPTPMYISSLGYAVFLNTSRPVDVYVGVGNRLDDPKIPPFRDRNTDPKWDAQPDSGRVEASVAAPGLEVLVFAGPTAMDALRRYNLFCGGGAMPPIWALGFWHRTPTLMTADQVIAEAAQFESRGFPLDVIGLEPGWQSRSYPGTMEWSPERFKDPGGFVQKLLDRGVRVNLWENPYVAPGSELFRQLTPRFGSHTVWLGAAPDVYDKETAKIVRDFHRSRHLDLGVSGYKIDEVDGFDVWLWPDHATFPSGLSGLHMRQIYAVLWQKELLRAFRDKGERTFGLVRASNGAASRFPFAIYSDTYDHRQYVGATVNCSLAGVIWCAEARDAANGEEWVRRMQSACLSPIAQLNAWASGLKPWSYPEVESEVRSAMALRESLVPHLYTAFAQYWLDGVPPVRPMCLVDGGQETDQYMLGDSLLVAPMFAGEKSRPVRLPKGKWYDYSTGALVGEGTTITVRPSLQDVPLYVREAAAIPTFPPGLRARGDSYLLRCYGAGPWKGLLYEDDGRTFAFEKGDYGLFELGVTGEGVSARPIEGKHRQRSKPVETVFVGLPL